MDVENLKAHITVQGQVFTALPEDLYIPPDALEVILENFTGPLDLLLYLIKKQNLDILEIPIAEITRQYVSYIELMRVLKIELAAEYLVMAAMLAEIKSRLLLPQIKNEEGEEEDPRAELVRRLLEYERFKEAAEKMDELPRQERDFYLINPVNYPKNWAKPEPHVDMGMLLDALQTVMEREVWQTHHAIRLEPLSIRERMTEILDWLQTEELFPFEKLFKPEEGRPGLVVSLIAILELARQQLLEMVQSEPLKTVYVKVPNA